MNIQKCEICEKYFIAGYGYSFLGSWAVTGHAFVGAYLCDEVSGGQHWGCSPEHAIEAFTNCLNNHLSSKKLIEKHSQTQKPRYSEEDSIWAEKLGDNFHIVTLKVGE